MPHLFAVGCPECNQQIAMLMHDMPHMDGYLSTDGYHARYRDVPNPPLAYVDDVQMRHTVATVCGDDGWLLALSDFVREYKGKSYSGIGLCRCGAEGVEYALWRGKVELR